jgi:tetratricopeptide (TPR) repeat protein
MESSGNLVFAGVAGVPFETWELGAVRINSWIPASGGEPYRPWTVLCRSAETGQLLASDVGRAESLPEMVGAALSRAAAKWRRRPARVEVADAELAGILEGLLAGTGVSVALAAELPELRSLLQELAYEMEGDDPTPSPLTGAGVTLTRLAAFAEAAAELLASDFSLLSGDDLVHVEAPEVEPGLRWFILGSRSYRPVPGLLFFPSPEGFEELIDGEIDGLVASGHWSVEIERPWRMPLDDLDLWERHGLPWAGEGLAPVARFFDTDEVRRPDARQLAFLEGLMRALARTAEEDLDAGRWQVEVQTFLGPLSLTLSLPGLLEPEPERPEAIADEDWAGELLSEAYDAVGRRGVRLARRALEVWPDCASAYFALAEWAPDSERALPLYASGLAVAERVLGLEAISAAAGRIYDLGDGAGPLLGCRFGLAQALLGLGRKEEAADHLHELLRLDPAQCLGAGHLLADILIDLGRDGEAGEVLDRSPAMPFTSAVFSRSLLAFRREGDSPEARRLLRRAVKANPGFCWLLADKAAPFRVGSPGGKNAALASVLYTRGLWERTPGALAWLAERSGLPRPGAAKPHRRPKKKKKKRRR